MPKYTFEYSTAYGFKMTHTNFYNVASFTTISITTSSYDDYKCI